MKPTNTNKGKPAMGFFAIAYPKLLSAHLLALCQEGVQGMRDGFTELIHGSPEYRYAFFKGEWFRSQVKNKVKGVWHRPAPFLTDEKGKKVAAAFSLTGAGNVSQFMSANEAYNQSPISFLNPAWAQKIAKLWAKHFIGGDFEGMSMAFVGSKKDANRVLTQMEVFSMICDLAKLQWRPNGALPPKKDGVLMFPLYSREWLARGAELCHGTDNRDWAKLKWAPSEQTVRLVKKARKAEKERKAGAAFLETDQQRPCAAPWLQN